MRELNALEQKLTLIFIDELAKGWNPDAWNFSNRGAAIKWGKAKKANPEMNCDVNECIQRAKLAHSINMEGK